MYYFSASNRGEALQIAIQTQGAVNGTRGY